VKRGEFCPGNSHRGKENEFIREKRGDWSESQEGNADVSGKKKRGKTTYWQDLQGSGRNEKKKRGLQNQETDERSQSRRRTFHCVKASQRPNRSNADVNFNMGRPKKVEEHARAATEKW